MRIGIVTDKETKLRNAWLKKRRKGIGGSDASAVLGLNNWKSSMELWEDKTGITEPEDISDKPFVKYGNDAEGLLRDLFALDYPQYKVIYEPYKIYQHKKHPFLQATLDGRLLETDTGRHGLLEIKTTFIQRAGQAEEWQGKIPDAYYVQILHCLNVLNSINGCDFAILKAQLKSEFKGNITTTCKHYPIFYDDVKEDIEILEKAEIEFWEKYVIPKVRPNKKLW